jgi:hypothetical protein
MDLHGITNKGRLPGLQTGVTPLYEVTPPNEPLSIFDGAIHVGNGSLTIERGRLALDWRRGPRLTFSGVPNGQPTPDVAGPTTLRLSVPSELVGGFVTDMRMAREPHLSGFLRSARLGRRLPVRSMLFHVANYHDYLGEPVRFENQGGPVGSRSRLILSTDEWNIFLDASLQMREQQKVAARLGGYFIGHAGLIERKSREPFLLGDASGVLSALHFFLTFTKGSWCGPVIPVGLGAQGQPLWSEWANWRISPFQTVRCWFPHMAPQAVGLAFSRFFQLWSTEEWNSPLRELINWYTEANLNHGALEGALVLSHTALELLAWMHVVVDQKQMSPKAFEVEPFKASSQRIRKGLTSLRVPTEIPSSLKAATAFALSEQAADAPELISGLRNTIVHPTPAKRNRLTRATHEVRSEVLRLSQHLLELGILALLDYGGEYVSRVSDKEWVFDATGPVPWLA